MSAAELSALISRLEAVATRIETTSGGAGAASGESQKKMKWKIGRWSKNFFLSCYSTSYAEADYSTLPTLEFLQLESVSWQSQGYFFLKPKTAAHLPNRMK